MKRYGLCILLAAVFPLLCRAGEPDSAGTNSFPSPAEVFQGRTFASEFERNVFFLQSIHDRYPSHWQDLLEANITAQDYVWSPAKLLRFVSELGAAMRDRNDLTTVTNLDSITSNEAFYANTNTYHPEILRAAAQALIEMGPAGQKALASSFTEVHYRNDSGSLEDLARTIGEEKPASPELSKALAVTAFDFSTANGGSYPNCTTAAVTNLLRLSDGVSIVRSHLKTEQVFHDPGRYQAIIDGIAAAHAVELITNLLAMETSVQTKLSALTNSPGAYRDDLQELDTRIKKTLKSLDRAK